MSHADTTIDLHDQGLILIQGRVFNRAMSNSNGSGKSALLPDSLLWCLFGKTLRGYKGSQVVSLFARKNCLVEIDGVLDDGRCFTVGRPQKHERISKPFVNVDGHTRSGNQEVKDFVEQEVLSGMSYETFMSACVIGRGSMKFFTQLDDASRKKILDEILNFTDLEQFRAQAVKKFTIAKEQSILESSLIQKLQTRFNEISQNIETLSQREKEYTAEQHSRLEKIQADIEAGNKEIQHASEEEERAKEDFRIKDDERSRLRCTISAEEERAKEVEAQEEEVTEKHKLAMWERLRVEREIQKIQKFQQGCPTCAQKLSEAKAKKLIRVLQEKAITFEKEIDRLTNLLTQLASKRNPELSALRLRLQQVSQECTSLQARFKEAPLYISSIKNNIIRFIRSAESIKDSIEKNPFTELLEAERNARKALVLERAKHEVGYKEAEVEKEEYAFWVEGFGNKGIKSFLMDGVLPFLNERAAFYSGILTDGELRITFYTQTELSSGELREKFDVRVEMNDASGDYEGCSDGQRRRADIICTFALGDLARARLGHTLDFAVLDEVFEGLDDVGIERAITLLHHLAEERNSVFCITHSDKLSNYFSKILTVEWRNGVSQLAEA